MKRLESNYMGDIALDRVKSGETVEGYAERQEVTIETLRRYGMVKANPKNRCSTEYLLSGDSLAKRMASSPYHSFAYAKSFKEQLPSNKTQSVSKGQSFSVAERDPDLYSPDVQVKAGESVFEYIDRTGCTYAELESWGMIHINPANCTPYLYEGDSPSAHISKLPHRVKGRD